MCLIPTHHDSRGEVIEEGGEGSVGNVCHQHLHVSSRGQLTRGGGDLGQLSDRQLGQRLHLHRAHRHKYEG